MFKQFALRVHLFFQAEPEGMYWDAQTEQACTYCIHVIHTCIL